MYINGDSRSRQLTTLSQTVENKYTHVQNKNGANHKEASSGMNYFISKPYRVVLKAVMHLCRKLHQRRLTVCLG